MLSRTVVTFVPQCTQVRGMATLKDIRLRLKSVTNIQKITKSMKMVSAAKYAKAERELKPARAYGLGATAFFEQAEVKQDAEKPHHLAVAMTSDRGLCGGVHSNVVKMIKHNLAEKKDGVETKLIVIGDKARTMLQRNFGKDILMAFNEIGKKPPVFADAAIISSAITDLDYKYDYASLFFNIYKSVVAYRTTEKPIFSLDNVAAAGNLGLYDSVDDEVLRCYNEFALVSLLYYALKEASCSELSSRMTAMDGASKNAGEMIDKLTLTFNRTRQAVITRELIEIISGAAAL